METGLCAQGHSKVDARCFQRKHRGFVLNAVQSKTKQYGFATAQPIVTVTLGIARVETKPETTEQSSTVTQKK